jgi:transcriptional regulator with XRE-family HTH domain
LHIAGAFAMIDRMQESRPTSIADRIRWVLRTSGMTQRELARASGLADTQISVMLKRLDVRPFAIELDTLLRIADGANVPFGWLILGEGQPDRGGSMVSTPTLVTLGAFAHWPLYVSQLYDANLMLPPDLIRWVAEIAFPLDDEHLLTPQMILDLAWIRFRQLYGAMAPALPPTMPARPPAESPQPRVNGLASRKSSPNTRRKAKTVAPPKTKARSRR